MHEPRENSFSFFSKKKKMWAKGKRERNGKGK